MNPVMNPQVNYPSPNGAISPTTKALKRGRMELYGGCYDNHGSSTSTYRAEQQQQMLQRPAFFKSHSASDAIFSSRHPPSDRAVMYIGNSGNRDRGLVCPMIVPTTPKRSRSVGYPVTAATYDYYQLQHPQQPLSKSPYPAVITPSRGLCSAYSPQRQEHWQQLYHHGKNPTTADTTSCIVNSDTDSFFASHHQVNSMNHKRLQSNTATTTNKIHFHPFSNGVQQVTPSNSCDYGDSLRSLPKLEYTDDTGMLEEPFLQNITSDPFEPYNILDKDGAVFPDIIEPYEVDCDRHPYEHTMSDFMTNGFVPDDDIPCTFDDDRATKKGDCNKSSMMMGSVSGSNFTLPDQTVSSNRSFQEGFAFPKEHEKKNKKPDPASTRSEDKDIAATTTIKNDKRDASSNISKGEQGRFRGFHEKKWNDHLMELREFKKQHGHCLVPHTFPENQSLARWVKRQRRQYKLLQDGDTSSTMTQDRVELLNREGFVWDSHEAVWRERYEQLVRYKEQHGHCRVPSYSKEYPQLATWVKCQRRQYKLFWEGKRSSMSVERNQLLEEIGFVWEVRSEKKFSSKEDSLKTLSEILSDL
mmetsp:Transcript_16763/g.31759  ORF Transcript_16763/g.31759 Transcript_16763/m.31759 type:complete len:583 (+) Transcript_16763:365-2113(+)